MQKRVVLALVSGLFMTAMQPSFAAGAGHPFDGNWVHQYSCNDYHMTPDDVKLCKKDGTADSFELDNLTQEGDRICGSHVATGNLTKRIDEWDAGASINGIVKGGVAKVRFKSSLSDDENDFGEATLKRVGDTLVWTKTKGLKGEDWFPDKAVLSRAGGKPRYEPMHCSEQPGAQ
ncbi:hypothetical protein [Trinickia acidisoli]|uniref:hypothetical protein n=1 Tax=Trinickia acidisoli TaxID=2767482 RepID=UPI001A906710|nr:hypothetical protein [Trinickia acidisoli]